MIPGLDRFREHFHGLESSYLLIGGAATQLVLDEAGLEFRATKDTAPPIRTSRRCSSCSPDTSMAWPFRTTCA